MLPKRSPLVYFKDLVAKLSKIAFRKWFFLYIFSWKFILCYSHFCWCKIWQNLMTNSPDVLTSNEEIIKYWTKFDWKFVYIRTKNNRGIWACPWYSWKVFNEHDLLKVIWKVLDSRCKRYSILNGFCHWKLN